MNSRFPSALWHWFTLLLVFCFCVSNAFASYQTITNDVFFKDTSGNPIYAQGGGISKFGNTYYWYGIQYGGASTYYSNPTADNSNTTFVAINCYSSTDIAHWKFERKVISTSTVSFTTGLSWIGRMGSVVYNSSTGQYVMWFQYNGPAGSGQACCTCSTPNGSFVLDNVQTAITNVYHDTTGDCTVFCDVNHSSTPYLIFSDPHGRQHAYVSPFSSDYKTIQPATLITEWPAGQEADCMFERNGVYYFCTSDTAGWSYSNAHQINSTNILKSYTADATFAGTDTNNTYYSQISFIVPVTGSGTTSYIVVGDRWSDFSNNYRTAGHALGFNIFCPVSFNGTTPTFLPMSSFQIDTVTGNWRATPAFAAPTGLTGTAGNAQVALSWDASGSATGYNVLRSTSITGGYTTIAIGVANTVYTDTTAANGTTYYYEIAAVSGTTTTTGSPALSAKPVQTFVQWIALAFPGVTDPAIIGETSDPDHDGYTNLAEYFFGTDPTSADSDIVTCTPDGSGNAIVTFPISSFATGVSYTIQQSTDMKIWTQIQGLTAIGASTSPVTVTTPVPGTNRAFYSVSVTGP